MFVVGTAGHVDHGKSALVEALTGIHPDRLREERERGLTIELGFAWLALPSGREVSVVDVPGHVRFIRHMLAGVGAVDLALLVVAADEGIMPQTREHLEILDLLEVPRGVVALTKCDLVPDEEWLALVEDDLRELLRPTRLAGAPLLRVSATARSGLAELAEAIDRELLRSEPPRDIGRPRLAIDRVFTMAGFGTVVTGTLLDGRLAVGDAVAALPGGPQARIRGLQTHRRRLESAEPGSRVAVNLAGVSARGLGPGQPGLPAQVDAERARPLHQILFDVILLDIDEGGPAVPLFRQQVEGVDELVAVEHLSPVPDDALGGEFGADAEPGEDLQAALGQADEPRPGAHRVILVHEKDVDAAELQVDGGGKPDGPGADDADRIMPLAPVEVLRRAEGIDRVRPARLAGFLHRPIIAGLPQPGQIWAPPASGALYSPEHPPRRGADPQWRASATSCSS